MPSNGTATIRKWTLLLVGWILEISITTRMASYSCAFPILDVHHTIIYMHIFATAGGCFEEKENEPADFVETPNLSDTTISNPDPVSPQPQTFSNFPVSTGKFFACRMFFATSYPLCVANFLLVVTFFLSNQPKFK